MAFTPHPTCKVCIAIQADGGQSLLKRIYRSRAFDPRGESLNQIARENEDTFSYLSLLRHAQRHQALDRKQLAQRRIASLSREIENEKIKQHYSHNDLRELVIDKGFKDIESGDVKLTATSIMTAAKQASDIEEKSKDRQIEVLKMIGAFASGELVREEIDGSVTSKRNSATEIAMDSFAG